LSGQQSGLNFSIQNAPAATFHEQYNAGPRVVAGNYFGAMGIPLLKGRLFAESDSQDSPRAVLINMSAERRYWPAGDALGKHVRAAGEAWREVVGVVGDVRHDGLAANTGPELYFPHAQEPSPAMNVVVRAAGDPLAMIPMLRQELKVIDKNQPITRINTMDTLVGESVARPRLYASVLAAFAALALLLAAVGTYGVISYSVAQRTREIGLRMALGAQRTDVLSLVTRSGLVLGAVGIAVGGAAAVPLRTFITKLLFQTDDHDPVAYATAAALLISVSCVASLLPAWRALRGDPVKALRHE
jgi:predicted permease